MKRFHFLWIIYFLLFIDFTMNLSRFLCVPCLFGFFFKWVEDEFQPLNVEGYRESEALLNS